MYTTWEVGDGKINDSIDSGCGGSEADERSRMK
jgi:hypothetical protein